MEKKDIIEIDVSEIPEELGKTLEDRVTKWLDLLEKGIRLVNKSKKEQSNTYQVCWYNCLYCPYNKNNWYYSTCTCDSSNKVSYNGNSITTCTYNKDETQTSNT